MILYGVRKEINDSTGPVLLVNIDWDNDFMKQEDIVFGEM
jgi:hypothetical protein